MDSASVSFLCIHFSECSGRFLGNAGFFPMFFLYMYVASDAYVFIP